MNKAITIEDVRDAARQLEGVAVHTKLIENDILNQRTGGRIFIKPECLQRTGSFKIRGAYNCISRLSAEDKKRGVVAFSSGNHAQGVACASRMLGVPATIVMPTDAPAIKVANTKGFGAEVVFYDRYTQSREDIADGIAEKQGLTVVPSYDHPHILAGQGTAGLEIIEDILAMGLELDAALFNCGGGGLTSGSSIAIKALSPATQVHAVEPSEFDDTLRSFKSGKIEKVSEDARSICDALLSPSPGALTFPILVENGVTGFTVTDDEVREAMRFAMTELKLIAEPGGAASLAALLAGKLPTEGRNISVIISGGNVDPEVYAEICASA